MLITFDSRPSSAFAVPSDTPAVSSGSIIAGNVPNTASSTAPAATKSDRDRRRGTGRVADLGDLAASGELTPWPEAELIDRVESDGLGRRQVRGALVEVDRRERDLLGGRDLAGAGGAVRGGDRADVGQPGDSAGSAPRYGHGPPDS